MRNLRDSPLFEKYRGPGAAEWLVALSCTVLIAVEIQTQTSRQLVQAGVGYYFNLTQVAMMHKLAIVLDLLMVAFTGLWMLFNLRRFAQISMSVVSVLGISLCWIELVYALSVQDGAVFALEQLPFQPVNNYGLAGAQVFGAYLILRTRAGVVVGWQAWGVRVALVVALWLCQLAVWQMVVSTQVNSG